MAYTAVAPVKPLGMHAAELAYALREICPIFTTPSQGAMAEIAIINQPILQGENTLAHNESFHR